MRMSILRFFHILGICIVGGCYQNHLYVQQEWVDANSLASSKIHTPDPRQANPPIGQNLIVAWDFPKSLFMQKLTMIATVRMWDNTEKVLSFPIERKRDTIALFFPNSEPPIRDKNILTYKVEVFSDQGDSVALWEHHFWTHLIELRAKEIR